MMSKNWNSFAINRLATEVAKNYNRAKSFGLEEDWRQLYFRTKAKCFRNGDNVASATYQAIIFASETCISILKYKATH
tara:strand:+ start:510 stop:743 length:234 start_codon:yes stop_codon:yes gene_type:complete